MNKKLIHYLILLAFAIIMCFPLFQNGIHTGHDGDFHIARTIGTIEQFKNGESPFIISRFSNHLGLAWNLFYPPLITFINVIFAVITGSAITSMKIFIFLTFILSALTMYKLVDTLTQNSTCALLAGIFYMLAPYRLLNAYTRLAVR